MNTVEFRQRLQRLPAATASTRITRDGFKHAAVLIPIVRIGDKDTLLFTRRTDRVETHKGQISFPGGVIDQTDTDVVDTALREAEEEIGISRDAVSVLGVLDDLETPTGFVITPVVGLIEKLPPLTPNTEEVEEIFQVGMEVFLDEAAVKTEVRPVGGIDRTIWYYTTGSHTIWGATAAIIRSLLRTMQLL